MPVPAKVLHLLALLGKEETTYGTAIGLTASVDGIQMQFDQDDPAALVNLNYLADGDIGPSLSSLANQIRTAPTGLFAEGTIPALLRLPAAAYSASVIPNLHRLFKFAGFDATVTTTTGSEKWAYTPSAAGTTYTSLTLKGYERGELVQVAGALANLQISGKDGKPPKFMFPFKGIGAIPSDSASLPAGLTYPNQTKVPVINQGISVTFGSFLTATVKSWDFDLGRKFDNARVNLTGSNVYAGVVPSGRKPILKLVLEATALVGSPYHTTAGFDPYNLRDSANQLAPVSIKVGSTQYNRFTVALAQAQVTNVTRQGEGPTATVELELSACESSPGANDDLSITCD